MVAKIAARRTAKAARRKQILKTRRAAAPNSLTDRVRRLAGCPLHRCLIQPEMFDSGMGTIILARRTETGEIAMATFLVDVYALGIKDVMFDVCEPAEFEFYVSVMNQAAPFQSADPSFARKLLRDAAAYAASLGLRPHRGSAAIMELFGDFRAEDCASKFSFGLDGKPFYVAGETETTRQIAMRLGRLTDNLGAGGFDFLIPIDEEVCLTSEVIEAAMTEDPAGRASEPRLPSLTRPRLESSAIRRTGRQSSLG
jgi:hypothetical protein